ncbi:MAG: hypothetical protein Q6351_003135 [Candidatus Njordarchaeum guaymaensis]
MNSMNNKDKSKITKLAYQAFRYYRRDIILIYEFLKFLSTRKIPIDIIRGYLVHVTDKRGSSFGILPIPIQYIENFESRIEKLVITINGAKTRKH